MRLSLEFYRNFAAATIGISLACACILYIKGPGVLAALFWIKVFTNVTMAWIVKKFKANEFYYFHNLGIPKISLWLISLIVDTLIVVLLLMIVLIYGPEVRS